MVRHFFAWRYISHMTLMMSTTTETGCKTKYCEEEKTTREKERAKREWGGSRVSSEQAIAGAFRCESEGSKARRRRSRQLSVWLTRFKGSIWLLRTAMYPKTAMN